MSDKLTRHHTIHVSSELDDYIREQAKTFGSISAFLTACVEARRQEQAACATCGDRRIAEAAREVVRTVLAEPAG